MNRPYGFMIFLRFSTDGTATENVILSLNSVGVDASATRSKENVKLRLALWESSRRKAGERGTIIRPLRHLSVPPLLKGEAFLLVCFSIGQSGRLSLQV